jgi:6-pyruvoyltetrahydropterin/6-carboxytetrahydropterin synthase
MSYLLEIDGWKNNITFSSGHIIFDHDKCGFLHGHTYAIHSRVQGEKNEYGFVIDFSILKSYLREIANYMDHRVLIPEKNRYLKIESNEIIINYHKKKYILPKVDCVLLPIESTTAENLASYILEEIFKKIKTSKNITKIEIGIDEGIGQGIKVEKKVG